MKMKCIEHALQTRFVEKERTYDFLVGLNMEFDAVRVQILDKEDLPSLNEVISIVRAEEGRRKKGSYVGNFPGGKLYPGVSESS